MRFDHAGIATPDADAVVELYTELFDVPVVHEEEYEGMWMVFLDMGNGYFEVIEPLEEDSTIGRHLDREGAGIHHLALETDDIEAAMETAREMGVELIDEEPRVGAWGHTIAFLHPRDTGGSLIEFVEH
jgi:methylmalonyl-CoA/ethylmalonyl-CoA epimerase